ncbi:MAG: amylo-alpha-1,6-glucosidase [Candidatus Nephthysia bennettiae]|nr:MAG: amylo-alpha-1,6-glucosidase [Candidatus Dormibacteraeota bacterium]
MNVGSSGVSGSRSLSDIRDALTTKSASIFVLAAEDGDVDTDLNAGYGVFFNDTRFLDRCSLRLGGKPLAVLLSSAEDNESVCELTNPEFQLRRGQTVGKNRIGIRRERRLDEEVIETVTVTNFGSTELTTSLEFGFAASFESMFAIRGAERDKRGKLHEPRWDGDCLRFRYDGADGRRRTTTLRFSPAPSSHSASSATFQVRLAAGASTALRVTAELRDEGQGELETSPGHRRSKLLREVTVETDNPFFDRALTRSFDDLRTLVTRQKQETFFAAGVPWFVALFGRDSLITALQTLAYDPSIAAHTLELLAKYQGDKVDDYRDEQPGKILHELRVGEMANLEEVPQTPYYGSVDATPLFVVLMAEYLRWTGDLALWKRLRPNVERALEWIDNFGDSDGDGFLDYSTRSSRGSRNQGWKDSGNSIRNRDGSLAEPPIALVEVQGYVYRAKLDAAWLFEQDGDEGLGARLRAEAEELRSHFENAYWMPDRKYLAVALQKDGRQAQCVTSNPGQALWSGIVSPEHAGSVVEVLMSDAMFSGWGVRTLAKGEVAFNPIDYQVGSVWPHDNSLIAAGLRRYGYHDQASRIFSSIFEAAAHFERSRLPEVFAGFPRELYPAPVRYPVACSPQAWSAGALPYLLQSALGLVGKATAAELEVRQPALPDWLHEVSISNLSVGRGRIDLKYRRSGGTTFVAVKRREGEVNVQIEE